ncbi:hypothetical protein PENTCL1PPCAC_817, partial [Pristionchus entomophagus]
EEEEEEEDAEWLVREESNREFYNRWLREVEKRANDEEKSQGKTLRMMADKLLSLAKKNEAQKREQRANAREGER